MDFSNIFRLINLGVGVVMILGGISQFFPISFQSVVIGCYVILFGLAIGLLVYIFVGSILLHDHLLRVIAGSIVGLTGVAYVVMEFIPSLEPPPNMREVDQGWEAEQV
ncbi:MAG: Late Golgi vesicles protein [Phylliscum demangeonii]|nr:MAG: Late Golgi vesicles protein [Phylliscum demangeonii]